MEILFVQILWRWRTTTTSWYQSGEYNSDDRFAEIDRKLKEKEVIKTLLKFILVIWKTVKCAYSGLIHNLRSLGCPCVTIG
jgi:hypothetical protein